MKDCASQYRLGILGLLENKIKINDKVLPVYNFVPVGVGYPYIILHNQGTVDNSTKDSYISNTSIGIEVVCGYQKGSGGFKEADSAANQIIQKLVYRFNRNTQPFTMSDFHLITMTLDMNGSESEITDTHAIFRRIIRINSIIQQK